MKVRNKQSDDWTVEGPRDGMDKLLSRRRHVIGQLAMRFQKTTNNGLHSGNWLPSAWAHSINSSSADVVNLHWVAGETMSVAEIGNIRKPLVWTLHDMWPFCGTEHYAPDTPASRWRRGYYRDNREPGERGIDLNRAVWAWKRHNWRKPVVTIAPSRWLAGCARESSIMRDWPMHVVPNPLDTEVYQPIVRSVARSALGLHPERKIILFGAMGGGRDLRKGFDLLQSSLQYLSNANRRHEYMCVIFGQSEPRVPPNLGFPARWMGQLHDDWSLSLLYSAADVMVVPSRQEAFGQTASEAQACGCPVVAFNTSGLPDVVGHRETGYLARPFDVKDMAAGIAWVLEDTERAARLSFAARERAVRLWSPRVVVPQYMEVYRQAVEEHSARAGRVESIIT